MFNEVKHRVAFAEGIPGCFVYWRNASVELGQQPMTLKVMSVAGRNTLENLALLHSHYLFGFEA